MSKTASSWSQSIWKSASWGANADVNDLMAKGKGTGHSNSIVNDKLIYVHMDFCFYYKCANNPLLHRALTRIEDARIMPLLDGDN